MMKPIRWGILSTGVIAKNFASTVAKMNGETSVLAVASRTKESADAFADAYGIERRYASYEELACDPDVDIVYVATPHSRHYEDMKLMLEHGKHVLCEKSFTVDSEQAKEIFALAKEKNLFVMEAFWTKMLPIYGLHLCADAEASASRSLQPLLSDDIQVRDRTQAYCHQAPS